MKKVMVLENFANSGERYSKGKIVSMSKEMASRFEKEGLVKDAIVALGLEVPQVDLSQYIEKKEHDKLVSQNKLLEAKIKTLESQVKKLESELATSLEKTKEEKDNA